MQPLFFLVFFRRPVQTCPDISHAHEKPGNVQAARAIYSAAPLHYDASNSFT